MSVSPIFECRICRDEQPPLRLSCRCNTHVHPQCLNRWLSYRADAQFPLLSPVETAACEVCNQPFFEDALNATLKSETTHTCGFRVAERLSWIGNYFITVEGCLLLFLFVLATMGHIIFVVYIYKSAVDPTQYSMQRLALALLNAVLTLTLLVVVQRVVTKWLRENDFLFALANTPLITDVESPTPTPQHNRQCGVVCQLLLGALLSAIAAAEIFFLVRQLPLGGPP